MNMKQQPALLRLAVAASLTGMSSEAFRLAADDGSIPVKVLRIGPRGLGYVRASELEAFLNPPLGDQVNPIQLPQIQGYPKAPAVFSNTYYTEFHPDAVLRELLATTGLDRGEFFCLDVERQNHGHAKVKVVITVEYE